MELARPVEDGVCQLRRRLWGQIQDTHALTIMVMRQTTLSIWRRPYQHRGIRRGDRGDRLTQPVKLNAEEEETQAFQLNSLQC